jgi:uncharacterized protein YbjQ (UPF0145 family)
LLSVPAVNALAAAGLEPADAVIGCIVMHLAWSSLNCQGYRSSSNRNLISPVVSAGPHNPYLSARYLAYETAIGRLLAEAEMLGVDGVVGITLTWSRLDSGAHELLARGTAVRERNRTRAEGTPPFHTELSAQDTGKLLMSGWRPLGIAIGLAMTVKHKDATMEWQLSNKPLLGVTGNTEVSGLTKLITRARADARQRLTERAAAFPGAAQVVISQADARSGHRTGQASHDVTAEATFVGTALARDHRAQPQRSAPALSILPLRDQ